MSAIILDFNTPLLFLDGTVINEPKRTNEDPNVPVMVNKMLATNLSQSQSKDHAVKMFHWAIDLYKDGKLTLDKVDRDLLKKTISEMGISTLVQGRTLEIIDKAEKAAEEVEKGGTTTSIKGENKKQPAIAN